MTVTESAYTDGQGFLVTTKTEYITGYRCTVELPKTEIAALDDAMQTVAQTYRESLFDSEGGELRVFGATSRLGQMVSVHLSARLDGAVTDYTWVYDTKEGVFRQLSDFFEEDVFPPQVLEPICTQRLAVYTGGEKTEEVRLAAAPIEGNYALFTLSPAGICLYFSADGLGLTGAARRVIVAHGEVEPQSTYHIPSTGTPLLWKRDLPAGLPPQDRPYKIALTFDDGPSYKNTPVLLEGLAKRGVKATFFMLGVNADNYPGVAAQVAAAGHLIGNHSYSHKLLTLLSVAGVKNEIESAAKAIEEATGVHPTLVRPPYGGVSNTVLANLGAPAILWSVDVGDWEYADANYICEATLKVVKDGDIILMHDTYATSVEAALMIIDDLSDKGYAFVTVEELIESRGMELTAGKRYYYARP
ncbi:MAG TPA: polysaccharide deacetylase family protein [Terriglobales bacterium]|nr:polysaccharide deacetylase family protein [Terriglobales bacterium]